MVIAWRGARERPIVEHALGDALGAGWRSIRGVRVALRRATASLLVPLDVIAVDEAELQRRRDEIGSVLHPALREGEVVHERAA